MDVTAAEKWILIKDGVNIFPQNHVGMYLFKPWLDLKPVKITLGKEML